MWRRTLTAMPASMPASMPAPILAAMLATMLVVTLVPSSVTGSRLAEQGHGSPCYMLDANGNLDLKRPQVDSSISSFTNLSLFAT